MKRINVENRNPSVSGCKVQWKTALKPPGSIRRQLLSSIENPVVLGRRPSEALRLPDLIEAYAGKRRRVLSRPRWLVVPAGGGHFRSEEA